MNSRARWSVLGGLVAVGLLVGGCEEAVYNYYPDLPDEVYGSWEAMNPEAVGLDEIELDLYDDGDYRYYARLDYLEQDESGTWDYDGPHEIEFYSEYVNGRWDGTKYEARIWVMDDDEIKVKFIDSDCECPVYFERMYEGWSRDAETLGNTMAKVDSLRPGKFTRAAAK